MPSEVLIVHQFTLGMLPDKEAVRPRRGIDLVLNMDGFGLEEPEALQLSGGVPAARIAIRRGEAVLPAGPDILDPAAGMGLSPVPAVVIYQ